VFVLHFLYTLIAQVTYANPSWRGFMKSDDLSKLKAIISRASRYGYLPVIFSFLEELQNDNDEILFRSTIHNPQHVLYQLLPPPKQTGYNLHARGHGLYLPKLPFEYLFKNFIYHMPDGTFITHAGCIAAVVGRAFSCVCQFVWLSAL